MFCKKGVLKNFTKFTGKQKEFSVSQKQAIIKLNEEKGKNKRYIKNWRPISLLNVGYEIALKALSTKLKNDLPSLALSEQIAYIKDKYIGETGRWISDIIEVSDLLKMKGFIVAMDIEKGLFFSCLFSKNFALVKILWVGLKLFKKIKNFVLLTLPVPIPDEDKRN